MPKVISASKNSWNQIALPGTLTNDENFQYLCSFEEIIPTSSDTPVRKSKILNSEDSAIKGKKRKIAEISKTDGEETTKKLKKKKRKVKKLKVAEKEEEKKEENSAELHENELDTENEVVDMSSWTSFGLPEEILRGLLELKFTQPTKIQELTIPVALHKQKDILGAAETGSGKTLAFAIPIAARLIEYRLNQKSWKALILAPTRELVVQVRKHIDSLIKYTALSATSIVGGLSQQKQERLLRSKPEIIVATPGRLWAMLETAANDSHLGNLTDLQFVVIDEIDRMVEKGHFDELELILQRIRSFDNPKRQTMVFSATLTYVHPPPKRMTGKQTVQMTADEKIKRLVQIAGLRKQHTVIDITKTYGTPDALIESRMNCIDLLDKDSKVVYLLKRYPGRTLIFTNSIDASRRLHGILSKLHFDPPPWILHAKMHQRQRLKNLDRFAETPNSILLATDVAARGLDIKGIENVIHYQVPKTAENYVHRSGRTARASNQGLTVLMVDPTDVQFYFRICKNLNRDSDLPVLLVDAEKFFDSIKARVQLASEVESLEHRLKKFTSNDQWFKKAGSEAGIEITRSEYEDEQVDKRTIGLKREKKMVEAQLRALLNQPLPKLNNLATTPELKSKSSRAASLFKK